MDTVCYENIVPAALDALTWSEDGEIAVGGDESVLILIPRLYLIEGPGQSHSLWHPATFFKTNVFKVPEEIPVEEPAGYETFSAGEELSSSHITAIKWSPPGLRRFKRCILTVLTSNLVLSLWAPTRGPALIGANWGRVLVLNHSIMEYYTEMYPEDKISDEESPRSNEMKRFQRIRCFTWAPRHALGSRISYGTPNYIAVANDELAILIISVTCTPNGELTVKVDDQISILKEGQIARPTLSWSVNDYSANISHAEKLAWSPWIQTKGNKACSLIAYAARGHIGFRKITMANNNITNIDDVEIDLDVTEMGAIVGPMRFTLGKNGHVTFVVCLYDRILSTSILVEKPRASKVYHRIREEWSNVGSVVPTTDPSGKSIILTSIHSDVEEETRLIYKLPDLKDYKDEMAVWQNDALERQYDFAADNELDGAAGSQNWGLDISPMGNLTAVAQICYPNDTPMYVIPSKIIAAIAISPTLERSTEIMPFPKLFDITDLSGFKSEAVAFNIRQWLYDLKSIDHPEHQVDDIIDKMLKQHPSRKEDELPILKSDKQIKINDAFSTLQELLRSRFLRIDQLRTLVMQYVQPKENRDPTNTAIFRTISSFVTCMAKAVELDPMSTKLVSMYKAFETARSTGLDPSTSYTTEESCPFCDRTIPFTDWSMGQCSKGHKFARCSLSFLCITAPRSSKSCGICTRVYLNPRSFPKSGTVDTNEVSNGAVQGPTSTEDSNPTLAKILFSVCDTCVYCGGKFSNN
ncbi:hypothetical protein BT63DRAFT_453323 [Microthyrium microscopicum]|uniref:Transcription factor IIIC putative zinc-finger domain-containing protein n=1 Tax=Microthyrium microscopicum TaxID=703497 RepID=A0A6A6UFJ2_9PEZI|nr:hypothetical protein BT63DRAFT_453323 [Microthyrium microscopicum]